MYLARFETGADWREAIETPTRVLRELEALGGEATLVELDDQLELSRSTIYKHLDRLHAENLVTKAGDRCYFGLRLLELGGYAREYDDIYQVAKIEVQQMAEEPDELANLVFLEDGMGVYVFTAHGEQAVDIHTHVGKRVDLHSTALGKALLSVLPDEEIRAIIDDRGVDAKTEQTITDADRLFEEIEEIRDSGIAYDSEEHIRGMSCVAAPIEIPGCRHASISATGPMSRVTTDDIQREYTQIVRRAANVIELNLTPG